MKMLKMWEVEVIGKESIKPMTPTPPHLRTHNLSWLDMIIPEDHIAFVLFYPNPSSNFISTLKTSLSQTLTTFYPLAGRLNDDGSSVDCNDQGIVLFQAHATADSPLSQLVPCSDSNPNISSFVNNLLPCVQSCSMKDNGPLLCVQITTFISCGGIAIGCCLSHRIADGHSAAMFIDMWTATACNSSRHIDSSYMMPSFDAASRLAPPSDDKSGCNMDWLTALQSIMPQDHNKEQAQLITKMFIIKESTICRLKESSSVSDLTRVQAVIALIWRCCMRARANSMEKKKPSAMVGTLVNMRGKVKTLPENLFGNLFCIVLAPSDCHMDDGAKLMSEEKVNSAIKAIDREKLTRYQEGNGWLLIQQAVIDAIKQVEKEIVDNEIAPDMYMFTSWTRFVPLYEANFGWGKPIWVAAPGRQAMNNAVTLTERSEAAGGGIEAWVTLEETEMLRFELDEEINT